MGEVINKVSEASGHDAICVTDVGQNQMMGARYFKFSRPRSLVTSGGLGTMGFGLPAGIGAKWRSRQNRLHFRWRWRFSDDHPGVGHDYGIRYRCKDYSFKQQLLGNGTSVAGIVLRRTLFRNPHEKSRLRKIAEAYGIKGRRVTKREELDEAISEMLNHKGAYLLEVKVETKGMVYPMVPAGGNITNILLGEKRKRELIPMFSTTKRK